MRRSLMAFAAVFLVPKLLGAQLIPGATPIDMNARNEEYLDAVIQGVHATTTKWLTAWRNHDVSHASDLYMDRAFIITPEGNRVSGRDSIHAYLARTLPSSGPLATFLLDVDASDRMAMTLEGYTLPSSQPGRPDTGGLLLTIYKSDGHKWRIRSQVFRPTPVKAGS